MTTDGSQINFHLDGVQIESWIQIFGVASSGEKCRIHHQSQPQDWPHNRSIHLAEMVPLEEDQYLNQD